MQLGRISSLFEIIIVHEIETAYGFYFVASFLDSNAEIFCPRCAFQKKKSQATVLHRIMQNGRLRVFAEE